MKKNIRFILLLIFCGGSLNHLLAQTTIESAMEKSVLPAKLVISGYITDARNGEPLAGASVYFPDVRIGATSDAKGFYKIQNIAQGKYLMEVSFQGYGSVVEVVQLNGDTEKNFTLKPTYVENEAITVTGVSAATSVKRTPVPVNILKREDLLKGASTNLIDALARTPGVSQVATGPAISKPVIRGLGYNRVVVINDGVRQEGQQWGDEHGIEIDELNVSRAEILKGPASLMYGSDAMAGVVNIISVRPTPEGTIKGNILGNYQSNNRQRAVHADINGNHNGFTWGINGTYKAAADYKNQYDGFVFNSKFNEQNFGAYAGINKHWGFSHILLSNFDQELGLVEGERDEASGAFTKPVNNNGVEEAEIATHNDFVSIEPYIPRQRIQHFKVASDNSFKFGEGRLTALIGYQRNQRQEFGNVLDPEEKSLFFDLNTVNYNVQFHFKEKNNWKTSVGANGMLQSNQNKGVEVLIPEYDLFDIGAFIYTQKKINNLTLSGGIRFDNRSLDSKKFEEGGEIKFQQFKRTFSNLSGSVGLSYEASKTVTMKLNLARGFRAPGISELASNGAHEGTNRFEYGRQDLNSETSTQVDAGFEIGSEHISFSLNLFYNSINNFIYYRKLSSVNGGDSIVMDGATQLFAFQYEQNDARLFGSEVNFDIHPHPLDWLHIENSFSYTRGILSQERDGSKNLPLIPAPRLVNELKAEFMKKGKTIRNVYLLAELDNSFAQSHPFSGFNTETSTAAYSLLNSGLGGEVVSKGRAICNIYFAANNITDRSYQNHLSRLKYAPENLATGRMGVFNMGRNFSFKLYVPLNFAMGKQKL